MRFQRERRFYNYLLPFFILLTVGGLLFGGLWWLFGPAVLETEKAAVGQLTIYPLEGTNQLWPWGGQPAAVRAGTAFLEGDSLQTGPGSRAVFFMPDFFIARLDANSRLTLDRLDETHYTFELAAGKVWLNFFSGRTQTLAVKTNLATTTLLDPGKYAVETGESTHLMVIAGRARLDSEGEENSTTFEVIEGQQLSFEAEKIPVSVQLISQTQQKSPWFIWNIEQDNNPWNFLKNSASSVVDNISVPALTIAAPVEGTVITADQLELRGTVTDNISQIKVVFVYNGVKDEYILKKYQPGSPVWTYQASVSLNNLAVGANRYEVYGTTVGGEVIGPVVVNVTKEK